MTVLQFTGATIIAICGLALIGGAVIAIIITDAVIGLARMAQEAFDAKQNERSEDA